MKMQELLKMYRDMCFWYFCVYNPFFMTCDQNHFFVHPKIKYYLVFEKRLQKKGWNFSSDTPPVNITRNPSLASHVFNNIYFPLFFELSWDFKTWDSQIVKRNFFFAWNTNIMFFFSLALDPCLKMQGAGSAYYGVQCMFLQS